VTYQLRPLSLGEILDGALTGPYRTAFAMSWTVANNPLFLDLYRRHGRDWNFLGVISLRTEWTTQTEKQLMANQTAKLAKQLGAQGAVVTWDAGGNEFIEVVRSIQACERLGIKTVFLTSEDDATDGAPTMLEPLPEADAIVSTSFFKNVTLAVPEAPDHPDAVFVEDTVVVVDDLAVLTHPGAPERRGEVEGTRAAVTALGLTVVEARHLGGQHGGHPREPAVRAQPRPAPDGGVGRPHCSGERHARLVRPDLELRVPSAPVSERGDEIGDRHPLQPCARRHVEEPPAHPFEPARDPRPRLEPHGVEAVGGHQLDGEAHRSRDRDRLLVELAGGGSHHRGRS